jgi:hypothetical protein
MPTVWSTAAGGEQASSAVEGEGEHVFAGETAQWRKSGDDCLAHPPWTKDWHALGQLGWIEQLHQANLTLAFVNISFAFAFLAAANRESLTVGTERSGKYPALEHRQLARRYVGVGEVPDAKPAVLAPPNEQLRSVRRRGLKRNRAHIAPK